MASRQRIVVPEAKDEFWREDVMLAVRSAQGVLKCRLAIPCLDETMEAEWKACKD